MKYRFILLSFILLFQFPAIAQNPIANDLKKYNFDFFYQYYKTTGLKTIVEKCNNGRRFNTVKTSFWSEPIVKQQEVFLREKFGLDDFTINNILSAETKVMKETCPEVW